MRQAFGQHFDQQLGFLVTATSCPSGFRLSVLNGLDISQHQFEFDGFNVRQRVNVSADMNHVFVFEAAYHLHDRVDLANVAKEFITEPFAFTGAFDDAGDVDQLQCRGDHFLWRDVLGNFIQPRVRYTDDAFVRLDRAKRIILAGGCLRQSQRVEQSTFTDVG